MNILFTLKSFAVGGVEKVTLQLANKFKEEGHHVLVFALCSPTLGESSHHVLQGIDIYIGNGGKVSKYNIDAYSSIVASFSPDVIINQWGQNFYPLRLIRKVVDQDKIKVITVLHCSPKMNGRLYTLIRTLTDSCNLWERMVIKGKLFLTRIASKLCLTYNYVYSDCFVLLSESFIDDFKEYVYLKNYRKLKVIHNPITTLEQTNSDSLAKDNIALFVGRIDENKNVSRIIEVWNKLKRCNSEWTLRIIGDGAELQNVKRKASMYNLCNVEFLGFQDPLSSYKKAKILFLTSDFEGVPLVVMEAMNNSCVPIVYGSFSSIYDVIENGIDGLIIKPVLGTFSAEQMALQTKVLLTDESKLQHMSNSAYSKSLVYSMSNIYREWLILFENN